MTGAEILREIQQLSLPEQWWMITLSSDCCGKAIPASTILQVARFAAAAQALLSDYQSDEELTKLTTFSTR